MRAKLVMVAIVIALVAAAYVFGFWPERARRLALEARAEALQTQLEAADVRLRVGQLLGRVLTVKELTTRQDYGLALERSSASLMLVDRRRRRYRIRNCAPA